MLRFFAGTKVLAKLVQAVMNATQNNTEQDFGKVIADFVTGAANATSGKFTSYNSFHFISNKINPKEMVIKSKGGKNPVYTFTEFDASRSNF